MECNFCKNTFSTKGNLMAHQKRSKYCLALQDKKPEKVYKCKYCEREFTLKHSYIDHTGKHESDKFLMVHYNRTQDQQRDIENLRNDIFLLEKQKSELQDEVKRLEKRNETIVLEFKDEMKRLEKRNDVIVYELKDEIKYLKIQNYRHNSLHFGNQTRVSLQTNVVDDQIYSTTGETNIVQNSEQIQNMIANINAFYDTLPPVFKIGIDLNRYKDKDSLYISVFKPTEEYIAKNMTEIDFTNRVFFKFGVSGEIILRSDNHSRDAAFIDYVVIKVFAYQNFTGRKNAEKRLKQILRQMKLRIKYYGKNEIFLSTVENFEIVVQQMSEHNETDNKIFDEQSVNSLDKMKIQNDKDIALEKIKIQNEKDKIRINAELIKNGNITFEQYKELTE
jgi:hypothetical protein